MIHQKTCYRLAMATLVTVAVCSVSLVARADSPNERVTKADAVYKELAADPRHGLPANMLNQAVCVIVLPDVKKAGFIVGGEYGKGVMSCRSGANFDGKWSPPIMIHSSGGSVGLQIGAEGIDLVILVMNPDGARAVMKGRAKLGADASVAAGPTGADAEAATTATMQAQMLSYSRAHGVFGGLSLAGTSLGPDDGDNEKLYGKKVSGEEIFAGSAPPSPSGSALISELEKASPKRVEGK